MDGSIVSIAAADRTLERFLVRSMDGGMSPLAAHVMQVHISAWHARFRCGGNGTSGHDP